MRRLNSVTRAGIHTQTHVLPPWQPSGSVVMMRYPLTNPRRRGWGQSKQCTHTPLAMFCSLLLFTFCTRSTCLCGGSFCTWTDWTEVPRVSTPATPPVPLLHGCCKTCITQLRVFITAITACLGAHRRLRCLQAPPPSTLAVLHVARGELRVRRSTRCRSLYGLSCSVDQGRQRITWDEQLHGLCVIWWEASKGLLATR